MHFKMNIINALVKEKRVNLSTSYTLYIRQKMSAFKNGFSIHNYTISYEGKIEKNL